MSEILKKSLLTGLGLASLTAEKVQGLAKELKEKGKLNEKEGRELADDLLKQSTEAKKELESKIEAVVAKTLGKLNLAPKAELDALKEEIEALKEKINAE
ncbi:MAG: hypothetical protein HQL32_07300 [Planctomycetes bacterium]|nr:hypothetical protein [Planctomycetota bacterium]